MPDQEIILLAEDSEDDILLIQRAFKAAFISKTVQVVRDGEECIAYLSGIGKFSDRSQFPLPELLLLDLKMPRVDGFEVLSWLRKQPSLNSLRVIVLTSSEAVRDVNRAYDLGANSFLSKPIDFQNYIEMCKYLSGFWLQMSKAPEISRPPPTPPFHSSGIGSNSPNLSSNYRRSWES